MLARRSGLGGLLPSGVAGEGLMRGGLMRGGLPCGPLEPSVAALVGTQVGRRGGNDAEGVFSDDAEDVGVLINFLLMVR